MKLLIVGAGRVGSTVARWALEKGNEVSVLDEDPLAIERLNSPDQSSTWEDAGGQFTVGTALEAEALEQAGVAEADVFIASTDGDNTNLVVAQIAQRKYEVPQVIVRVLDPRRAEWYAEQGLQTISPTQIAIDMLQEAIGAAAPR
jgi:trk system potassium uptake protein TrkA